MATIYGEKKRGRKKLVIFVAVLAAVSIGIFTYHATRPEPEDMVSKYSEDMLGALEILNIEYSEAVKNGSVVEESEYEGARLILGRIVEQNEKMKPHAMLLHPDLSNDVDRDLNLLKIMLEEKAPPGDVEQLIEKVSEELRDLQA